ncbi:MAG: hypothetical protein NC184_00680 [Roseburia sp.]|nr:hypothetical protein [Roseburia sp.]
MSNFATVLKALFKNKLRFGTETSTRKKVGIMSLFALAYAVIMFSVLSLIVTIGNMFDMLELYIMFYMFLLMTAAIIVLIFGIVNLISVLYLSKDTDFYSALPIKPSVVFAAKLAFVYLMETAIVLAVLLPGVITLGVISDARAWYYVISILTVVIVPALPLFIACIFAIPVMFFASKLKNRAIVSLVFYLALFGAMFGVYIYFITVSTGIDAENVTEAQMQRLIDAVAVINYIFYPYNRLILALYGVPSFGLGVGASTVVNLLIFLSISIALTAVLLFAAKFMYSQSVKENNQTNDEKAKKGEFKANGSLRALVKREYLSSLRTTQVAFQCYAVMLLPIIVSVILGIMFRNIANSPDMEGGMTGFFLLMLLSFMIAIFASLGNAASTTFSREGNAFSSLKILPLDIKRILLSKVLAWLIPSVAVAAVCLIIINAMIFDALFCVLSFIAVLPLVAEFITFGALWDLGAPKLKWTDPTQAIKHNTHVTIGQVLMMGSGFLSAALLFILSATPLSANGIMIVQWCFIFAIVVTFAVVDILLYRKANVYYDRIEI